MLFRKVEERINKEMRSEKYRSCKDDEAMLGK